MENPAQFFKAMSDTTRLQIIALLMWEKELCVCDIENVLDLSQSKASRHLRYLLNSGILTDKRKNIWVYYSIDKGLPDNKKEFLNLFSKNTKSQEWSNLKLKLEDWVKSKVNSDHCNVKGDV